MSPHAITAEKSEELRARVGHPALPPLPEQHPEAIEDEQLRAEGERILAELRASEFRPGYVSPSGIVWHEVPEMGRAL